MPGRPLPHPKSTETRIYEALFQLMDVVGPLCDFEANSHAKTTDAYFKIAGHDRELNT